MCVIYFAFRAHERHPLIVAANRDEFYDRPTASAAVWEDAPEITAGRDLVHGGTWLGITSGGRFAAITNFRQPSAPKGSGSRGEIVRDFLIAKGSVEHFLADLESRGKQYSGFNLIAGEFGPDRAELGYYSNRGDGFAMLPPGIYGLSNHLLDTPWPKVRSGKDRFSELVASGDPNPDNLFDLLSDKTLAPDGELPETGVGIERERLLSAIFIETPIYGTRSSSIVFADADGRLSLAERTFV